MKKKCFGSKNKSDFAKNNQRKKIKSANEIKKVVTNHKSEGKSFLLRKKKKCVQLFNDRLSCKAAAKIF